MLVFLLLNFLENVLYDSHHTFHEPIVLWATRAAYDILYVPLHNEYLELTWSVLWAVVRHEDRRRSINTKESFKDVDHYLLLFLPSLRIKDILLKFSATRTKMSPLNSIRSVTITCHGPCTVWCYIIDSFFFIAPTVNETFLIAMYSAIGFIMSFRNTAFFAHVWFFVEQKCPVWMQTRCSCCNTLGTIIHSPQNRMPSPKDRMSLRLWQCLMFL